MPPTDILNPSPEQPKGKTSTPDEVLDILNSEDTADDSSSEEDETPTRIRKPRTEPSEDSDKDDEEEDDDDEIDIVDTEDEVEKLDLEKPDDDIEIAAPPRKREILAKYPNIFKDFPFMEKVIYRDRQYTELFGSFDDAKEIASKKEIFDQFDNQLMSGDTEQVLKSVKDADPKAFDKIVDNYMKSLAKVDKDAYFEVASNVIRQAVLEMSQDENYKDAAMELNRWMGWGTKLTSPKARVEEKQTAEQSEAEKERLAYVQERFVGARDTLQTQTNNSLKATIDSYIDPRGQMTGYLKKKAIGDALDHLGEGMNADPSFRKNLDNLWRASFNAKFSQESLDKIKRFYLGRAKSILPKAIAKARAEALKDLALAPRKEREEDEDSEREATPRRSRGPIPSGGPSRPKKNEMKKGESVSDFFSRD